jgi:malate synthase
MTDSRQIDPGHDVPTAGLTVDPQLLAFLVNDALPGTGISPAGFFDGLAGLVAEFGPRNRDLLDVRASMQASIDRWHRDHQDHDPAEYRSFLESMGYLRPTGPAFSIEPENVDKEVAEIAGPQLVVPVTNARYALNAANARWGSLYDAVYGTDALGDGPPPGPYDAQRGARVISWVREFLDRAVPLESGSHLAVTRYDVIDGELQVELGDAGAGTLADTTAFRGHRGPMDDPTAILLEHHGLGIEIVIDRDHPIGSDDLAGVADVMLESAVTTIVDCEDSVATVDGGDKALAYRNWLGLLRGDLTAEVTKNGETFTRTLADDRTYTAPDGSTITRPGRSLLFTRNVGHLMTTPAVRDVDGNEIPEGILDALVTVTCALRDVDGEHGPGGRRNSRAGSIYVVKPKMHGPDEVAFTVDLFTRVEEILGLPTDTVKIGIMDEERRTTVNLMECIRAARTRVCFVNTGFLDRTGDEIHTSMYAGPMVRKGDMKSETWITAYEDWNVDTALACGFRGKAQIGKGMWAAPERMAAMLDEKIAHPLAGAGCAWVPSPTAATLHATHYHLVDVAARQEELAGHLETDGPRATLDDLLTLPVAGGKSSGASAGWTDDEIGAELDNNAQGILGYVVRWVDQGVGCSTVPDIDDIGLMEDRATCRISSQHIANWLHHGVVDADRVMATMRRMAEVVDRQNADDPAYTPMAPGYDGAAFRAACDLVLSGVEQPSGYTEPILHARRAEAKRSSEESRP